MSTKYHLYLLKAARTNHAGSPHLEQLMRVYKREILKTVLSDDQVEEWLKSSESLEDEVFAKLVDGLAALNEIPSIEPEIDITHEILKAKYGGKQ